MTTPDPPRRWLRPHLVRRCCAYLLCGALAYYLLAYQILPVAWRYRESRHPALQSLGTRTVTREGIPGDPINVALIADERRLHETMMSHGWLPADPVTVRAAARIAADSVLHRPYDTAPVSDLYFWGHRQDLSFEQMVGDPRRRHHVRFWRSAQLDSAGRPLWVGAATLDTRAGVSHLTGQITHHIDADVDLERDKLLSDLEGAAVAPVVWIDAFQSALHGRNGGGDPYDTDGRLVIVTLN